MYVGCSCNEQRYTSRSLVVCDHEIKLAKVESCENMYAWKYDRVIVQNLGENSCENFEKW